MRFYLPDHPITNCPSAVWQFAVHALAELREETRHAGPYVTDNTGPFQRKLEEEFGESRLLDDFWSVYRARRGQDSLPDLPSDASLTS